MKDRSCSVTDSLCSKVLGRVTNNTSNDDANAEISVIFYDSSNDVIGIASTSVYNMKAGETKSFEVSTLYALGDNDESKIDHYDVIAYEDYWQW